MRDRAGALSPEPPCTRLHAAPSSCFSWPRCWPCPWPPPPRAPGAPGQREPSRPVSWISSAVSGTSWRERTAAALTPVASVPRRTAARLTQTAAACLTTPVSQQGTTAVSLIQAAGAGRARARSKPRTAVGLIRTAGASGNLAQARASCRQPASPAPKGHRHKAWRFSARKTALPFSRKPRRGAGSRPRSRKLPASLRDFRDLGRRPDLALKRRALCLCPSGAVKTGQEEGHPASPVRSRRSPARSRTSLVRPAFFTSTERAASPPPAQLLQPPTGQLHGNGLLLDGLTEEIDARQRLSCHPLGGEELGQLGGNPRHLRASPSL